MSGPYLVMGHSYSTWRVIGAWVTKDLAIAEAEKIKAAAIKKMGARFHSGSRWKPWKPWKTVAYAHSSLGGEFPGKAISAWSANSVGGTGGNEWTDIMVVELEVQGTVLDRIVEATSPPSHPVVGSKP